MAGASEKPNAYIRQFENNFVQNSATQSRDGYDDAIMRRSSRSSDENKLRVTHHPSDSPRVELEDSTGILDKSRFDEPKAFYARQSESFYDRGGLQGPSDGFLM